MGLPYWTDLLVGWLIPDVVDRPTILFYNRIPICVHVQEFITIFPLSSIFVLALLKVEDEF